MSVERIEKPSSAEQNPGFKDRTFREMNDMAVSVLSKKYPDRAPEIITLLASAASSLSIAPLGRILVESSGRASEQNIYKPEDQRLILEHALWSYILKNDFKFQRLSRKEFTERILKSSGAQREYLETIMSTYKDVSAEVLNKI